MSRKCNTDVLQALAEALWPGMPEEAEAARAAGDEALARYYSSSGFYDPMGQTDLAIELIYTRIWAANRQQLLTHAFVGRAPFLLAFAHLPLENRQRVISSWARSPLTPLRKAFKGIKSLLMFVVLGYVGPDGTGGPSSSSSSSSSSEGPASPLLEAMGYQLGVQVPLHQGRSPAAVEAEQVLEAALTDLQQVARLSGSVHASAQLRQRGFKVVGEAASAADVAAAHPQQQPGRQEGSRLISADSGSSGGSQPGEPAAVQVECDVVVVGSGAGGGVAAGVLAGAGLRVIVLEKGQWLRMAHMRNMELADGGASYENGMLCTTEDSGVNILAGATLGGGTKVNWAAALAAPDHVRQEWSEKFGLVSFTDGTFDRALQLVHARMHVDKQRRAPHNRQNARLQAGLAALGCEPQAYPTNCDSDVCSGYCTFGCRSGHKQSTDITFLADAARAGARVLTNTYAERVMLEHLPRGTHIGGRSKVARALLATATCPETGRSVRLEIRARAIVSSAGSLHTPALLLRSGVTCGGAVGRNLRLHPASVLVARFPRGSSAAAGAAGAAPVGAADGGSRACTLGPGGKLAADASEEPDACEHSDGSWENVASCSADLASDVAVVVNRSINCDTALPAAKAAAAASVQYPISQQQQQQQQQQRGYGEEHFSPLLARSKPAVDMWSGAMMTVYSRFHAAWDGCGYGPMLSIAIAHPGLLGAAAPWLSGRDCKLLFPRLGDAALFLVFVRDRDAGRVHVRQAGRPIIEYWPSAFDRASIVVGLQGAARAALAAGACELMTMHEVPGGLRYLVDRHHSQARLDVFLEQIAHLGITKYTTPIFSAHQMGTCRMGVRPGDGSACDPQGECWEAAGLLVADTSLFPTPSGANPMVTCQAVAAMVAQGLAARLTAKAGSGAAARRGAVDVQYQQ